MHGYLDTIGVVLDGLTRLLSMSTSDQYVSSQSAVATARTSITSVRDALTTADQSVTTAQSSVSVAQKQLDLELGGSTKSTIAAQQAAVASAQARVNELEDALGDQRIVAPFAGIVAAVPAKVSEAVHAGETAVSLISEGPLKIEGYVPETHYANLAVGQPVAITLTAFPGKSFTGTLDRIDPIATAQNRVPSFNIVVHLTSADPALRPGLTADLSVETAHKTHVLAIPLAAVSTTQKGSSVIRQARGQATSVPVTLGIRSSDGYAEVLSGLSAGDTVLVDTTRQYRIVPD